MVALAALLVVPAVEPPRGSAVRGHATIPSTATVRARRGRGAGARDRRRTTCAPSSTTCSTSDSFLELRADVRAEHGHRPRPPRRATGRRRRQPADVPRRHARHRGRRRRPPASCSGATASTSRSITFVDTPRLRAGPRPRVARHDPPRRRAACTRTRRPPCRGCASCCARRTAARTSSWTRKDLGNDWCVAWPTAEIAVMGAPGAVQILYRRKLAAIEDDAERLDRAARARGRVRRALRSTRTSPPSAATSTT